MMLFHLTKNLTVLNLRQNIQRLFHRSRQRLRRIICWTEIFWSISKWKRYFELFVIHLKLNWLKTSKVYRAFSPEDVDIVPDLHAKYIVFLGQMDEVYILLLYDIKKKICNRYNLLIGILIELIGYCAWEASSQRLQRKTNWTRFD